MYLGIDVGGSKTLVAVLSEDGQVTASQKVPTPAVYEDFLKQLQQTVASLSTEPFKAACVALPGRLDREHGTVLRFGNLSWKNVPIKADAERLFNCPTMIENDAKLAGLSEANLIIKDFKRVLYITISTGIGISIITNGVIDQNVGDRGGDSMIIEHDDKLMPWEDFASGKAIKERYGKLASEINDPAIWQEIAPDLAIGILDLVSVLEPDVVVIGGGVGTHFQKFEQPLLAALKAHETPMMLIPPIVRARRPEEAVIYGCYDLLKERYGQPAASA